jgi:hypothetical protein
MMILGAITDVAVIARSDSDEAIQNFSVTSALRRGVGARSRGPLARNDDST